MAGVFDFPRHPFPQLWDRPAPPLKGCWTWGMLPGCRDSRQWWLPPCLSVLDSALPSLCQEPWYTVSPSLPAWGLTALTTGARTGPRLLPLSPPRPWALTRPPQTSWTPCCHGECRRLVPVSCSWSFLGPGWPGGFKYGWPKPACQQKPCPPNSDCWMGAGG